MLQSYIDRIIHMALEEDVNYQDVTSDFLIDEKTNGIFLNEINTFPGFTPISMYPKLMEQMGMKFSDLVDEFINLALEKQVALAL